MKYYLEHRTNYWGSLVNGDNRDEEVEFEVIWVQICDRYRGCCPGFGERCVHIRNRHFRDGRYQVYLVSKEEGRKQDHFFYKFVVIPEGKSGWGKQECIDIGWEFEGDIDGSSARSDLKALLFHYKENSDYENTHLHLGLDIDEIETR